MTIALFTNLLLSQLDDTQSYLLTGILGHARITGGYLFRNINMNLQPVNLLLQSQSLHVAGVILGIINGVDRTEQVKVLYQHTFFVKVGNTQRSLHGVHTTLPTPRFYRLEQCLRNLFVVDELNHRETNVLSTPAFIRFPIDNTHHSSDGHILTIGYKGLDVGKFQPWIFLGIKQFPNIRFQIRYILRTVLIDRLRYTDEIIHVFLAFHFSDNYLTHLTALLWSKRYSIGVTLACSRKY